jgi:hypothetical protein
VRAGGAGAAFWWSTVPEAVGRVTRVGRVLLGDGSPVGSSPAVAAVAPAAALAVGVAIGALRPGNGFSYSVLCTSLLAAVAAAGAAYGVWALVGYAAGDLTLGGHPGLFLDFVKTGGPLQLIYGYLPVLFSYVLLAGLMVWGPLVGMAARGVVAERVRASGLDFSWAWQARA